MSRRLAAMFAERVLGWTYKTYPDGVCPHIKHWSDADGNLRLRSDMRFTASLDLAWKGVEKLAGPKLASVDFVDTASGWCCDFSWGIDNGAEVEFCTSPAAALVKACLLAVGVTQQEIEEAERG